MANEKQQRPGLRKKRRQWSDADMEKAMELIMTGEETILGAASRLSLPYTTVYTRYKGRAFRPKIGSPTVFPVQLERSMRAYVLECTLIGIPLWKDKMAMDVQHYVTIKDYETPFVYGIPGNGWFTRFQNLDNIPLSFVTIEQARLIKSTHQSMLQWNANRKNYIKTNNGGKLLESIRSVFLVEFGSLSLQTTPDKEMKTVMIYNSNSELLHPIVLHDGQISEQQQEQFAGKLSFYRTDTGDVNRSVVVVCIVLLHKYVQNNHIPFPLVMNMTPPVADYFSFLAWTYAQERQIISQVMPQNLHNSFKNMKWGAMVRMTEKFDKLIQKRYMYFNGQFEQTDVPDLLWEAYNPLRLTSHINATFQRFGLNDVQRAPRQAMHTNVMHNDEAIDVEPEYEDEPFLIEEVYDDGPIEIEEEYDDGHIEIEEEYDDGPIEIEEEYDDRQIDLEEDNEQGPTEQDNDEQPMEIQKHDDEGEIEIKEERANTVQQNMEVHDKVQLQIAQHKSSITIATQTVES